MDFEDDPLLCTVRLIREYRENSERNCFIFDLHRTANINVRQYIYSIYLFIYLYLFVNM